MTDASKIEEIVRLLHELADEIHDGKVRRSGETRVRDAADTLEASLVEAARAQKVDIDEARSDAVVLRQALDWYANTDNYNWGPALSQNYKEPTPIEEDGGAIARAVLAKPGPGTKLLHYVASLEVVAKAADRWLAKSRHAENCPFFPLGATCTCGLADLDSTICALEEATGQLLNPP